MLPSLIHKIELVRSNAQFLLIVEKDATFQHLIEGEVFNELGPCIIITVSPCQFLANSLHSLGQ